MAPRPPLWSPSVPEPEPLPAVDWTPLEVEFKFREKHPCLVHVALLLAEKYPSLQSRWDKRVTEVADPGEAPYRLRSKGPNINNFMRPPLPPPPPSPEGLNPPLNSAVCFDGEAATKMGRS